LFANTPTFIAFLPTVPQGLFDRPLPEVPVLTKAMLMEHFDELVSDRAIRLADVRAHIASGEESRRYLNRYWVSATSGTSGQPGLFLFEREEWIAIPASFARG
jgi:phenylacetate-coenzyme A ligase PaaK-like adenylate-forming protein